MQNNAFEVHIAIPNLLPGLMRNLFAALTTIGFTDCEFVNSVWNAPTNRFQENAHDLPSLGAMATVQITSLEEAIRLTQAGMEMLGRLGVTGGNFEIEQVLVYPVTEFNLAKSMPTFQAVHGPKFESHASVDEDADPEEWAIKFRAIGLEIDQAVKFGYAPDQTTCTVFTFYRDTVLSTFQTGDVLKRHATKLGLKSWCVEAILAIGA